MGVDTYKPFTELGLSYDVLAQTFKHAKVRFPNVTTPQPSFEAPGWLRPLQENGLRSLNIVILCRRNRESQNLE